MVISRVQSRENTARAEDYSWLPLVLVVAADLILLGPVFGGQNLLQANAGSVPRVLIIWGVLIVASCGFMVRAWPIRVISLAVLGLVMFAGAFTIGMFYAPAFISAAIIIAAQNNRRSEPPD